MHPGRLALVLLAACAEPTTPAPAEYETVALGPLVGPADCPSEATGVNPGGVVVGTVTCGFDDQFGFVFDGAAAQRVQSGTRTKVLDVNAAGDVLVQVDTARPPLASPAEAWFTTPAFAPTTPTAFHPLRAMSLNDVGYVAGSASDTASYLIASVSLGGPPILLGTLGGRLSGALDINNANEVVGWSETDDFRLGAFRWSGGTMTELNAGGRGAIAAASNAAGVVVGWTMDQQQFDGGTRPVRWDGAGMTELPTLGGEGGWATDVNDDGLIVGASHTRDGRLHATLWRDGVAVDLGTLPGTSISVATRISATGDVVGTSGSTAVLWRRIR